LLKALSTLLVAVALLGCTRTTHNDAGAGDFSLRGIDGEVHELASYRGELVVVLFFATWDKPSRALLKQLSALESKYGPRGLAVVGVSIDGPESMAQVKMIAKRSRLDYPVLLDEDTSVVAHYNPKRILPYVVFIGPKGNVVDRWMGHQRNDEAALARRIERLLDRHAVQPSSD
jgi:peroxiredoxin